MRENCAKKFVGGRVYGPGRVYGRYSLAGMMDDKRLSLPPSLSENTNYYVDDGSFAGASEF